MKKVILLFNILLFLESHAQQPVANSELQTLIRESFSYYPELKEMEQQLTISEMRVGVAETYRLPTVSGNATYSYVNPVPKVSFPVAPGQYQEVRFQPNNNLNGYIGLNYTLIDFGRVRMNVEKAREELNQSKHGMEMAQYNLAAQVTTIYYSIVFIKKNIAIQDSILIYLEENKKVTESKYRHGDALQVDILNVQALIDNENNRKIDLQNSLRRNFNLLQYAAGKDTVTQAEEFDFVFDNTNLENLLAEAHTNPQFRLAEDRIKIARTEVSLSRIQRLPGINVMANAGYRNGYMPDIYKLRFNYLLGAGITVPIYSGGRINLQTAVSQNMLRLNELKVNTLENTYRKDIQQALDDIASLKDRLGNVESQIVQARAAQQVTASRYKNGTATYLDLTSASANFQRAHTTKLQYQYQLCQAYIELSRLTGVKYW